MFDTAHDYLANLVVLSPKLARKRFRQHIFESWGWKCAYCDCDLNENTATIDHIRPRHKGGKSTRANMAASCVKCNFQKASRPVFDYYNETHPHYSEQRASKIKMWVEQQPAHLHLTSLSTEHAVPYLDHDSYLCWTAS